MRLRVREARPWGGELRPLGVRADASTLSDAPIRVRLVSNAVSFSTSGTGHVVEQRELIVQIAGRVTSLVGVVSRVVSLDSFNVAGGSPCVRHGSACLNNGARCQRRAATQSWPSR